MKIATDGNFPFEHRFVTARITPAINSFRLRARASDTGGNFTWSDEIAVALVPDATPPHITRLLPSTNSVASVATDTLFAYFNEPMALSTLNRKTFKLLSAGPDNRLWTSDDMALTNGVISYRDTLNAAVMKFPSALPVGLDQVVVGPTIADVAGNPLGQEFRSVFGILSPVAEMEI